MLTLHHLEQSRSHRLVWLLELLELDYELKIYQRDPQTLLAPESLQQLHPLGKSPILTDGKRVLAESGAIIEYLLTYYAQGRLQPSAEDQDAWMDYRYWLHYAEASLMPLLLMQLVFSRVETSPMPFFVKPVAKGISSKVKDSFVKPNLERHLDFIEQQLQGKTWFLGKELTAADVQMSFPMLALAKSVKLTNYPNIQAYNQRLKAEPAWQRVVAKVGALELPA